MLLREVIVGVLLASGAFAQTSASLTGTVHDPSGGVVKDARVMVTSSEVGLSRSTLTDDNGNYGFAFLPVGNYQISVRKQGFQDVVRSGVRLALNEQATVNFDLQVGNANQEITVTGDAELVNTATQDVSGVVTTRQIESLPLNGRSYDELMTLNPGIVNFTWEKTGGTGVSNSTAGNNFAASGNRPQQNLYLLNGVEFTGAAENNMQPGGVSQELLGVEAVEEFNLLRDNYGAEYGKHPGAQVLIATKSGTDEFHGSVYEFVRNGAFDARNFFDGPAVPGFTR